MLLIALISILSLVLILIVALQFTATQRFAVRQFENWLEKKLETEVELAEVNISFPQYMYLGGVYVEDRAQDTLIYADEMRLDFNMWGLLNSDVQIESMELKGATATLSRSEADSVFNFNFIIEAFSKDTSKVSGTKQPMILTVDYIKVEDTEFHFWDDYLGSRLNVYAGLAELEMRTANVSMLAFFADDIRIDDALVELDLVDFQETDEEAESGYLPWLGADNINLSDIMYKMTVNGDEMRMEAFADSLFIHPQVIDLRRQEITATDLYASGAGYRLWTRGVDGEPATAAPSPFANPWASGWRLAVDDLDLLSSELKLELAGAPPAPGEVDWNHLHLTQINLRGNNVLYSNSAMKADIQQLTFRDRSGFVLDEFHGNLAVTAGAVKAENLLIRTPQSYVSADIKSDPAFIFGGNSQGWSGRIDEAHVAIADLKRLIPANEIDETLDQLQADQIHAAGNISGTFDRINLGGFTARAGVTTFAGSGSISNLQAEAPEFDLDISKLATTGDFVKSWLPDDSQDMELPQDIALSGNVSGNFRNISFSNIDLRAEETTFAGSGSIQDLQTDNPYFDVDIENLTTTADRIRGFMKAPPQNVELPENISLSGHVAGTPSVLEFDVDGTTSMGDFAANMELDISRRSGNERYSGTLSLTAFNIGRLLQQQQQVGQVTGTATVSGTGFDPATMVADIRADVTSIDLKDYSMSNIFADGRISDGAFSGNFSISDPKLRADLSGTIGLTGGIDADVEGLVEYANLQALNVSQDSIIFSGRIDADLAGATFDSLRGNVEVLDGSITMDGQQYDIDTLTYSAEEGSTDLQLRSEFGTVEVSGNLNLAQLVPLITQHIDQYFDLASVEPGEITLTDQDFTFKIEVKQPDLIRNLFLPQLKELEYGIAEGHFDSQLDELVIDANLIGLEYGKLYAGNLYADLSSDSRQMEFSISSDSAAADSLEITNLSASGYIRNDSVIAQAQMLDDEGETRFAAGASLISRDSLYVASLIPGTLVLNRENWQVNEDNHITFGQGRVEAGNLRLTHGEQEVFLRGSFAEGKTNLKADFSNFQMGDITALLDAADAPPLGGEVNGSVTITDLQNMVFTSDITIDSLTWDNYLLGDADFTASSQGGNQYDVNGNIIGNGNDIAIRGNYIAGESGSPLQFIVRINEMNLASLVPLSGDVLSKAEGIATGALQIEGTLQDPQISGEIRLPDASFTPKILGTALRVENESIRLTPTGIFFDTITLYDSVGNTATIAGRIRTENYQTFYPNLQIETREFMVLNSNEGDNNLYYGKVIMNSDIQIGGTLASPEIRADAEILGDSRLHINLPNPATSVAGREGVMEFVDMSEWMSEQKAAFDMAKARQDSIESSLGGMEMDARLSIAEGAELFIIVDPVAGDFLRVQGAGSILMDIGRDGSLNMTGRYEIDEGEYVLTLYDLVRRRFDIMEGSFISWNGAPLDATVNVSARYETRAAPMELVADQLAGLTEDERDVYRQKLRFWVLLNMEGQLLNPEFNFALDMPDEEKPELGGIPYAKIQILNNNQGELNKQVFALMTLGRFISNDPFQFGGEDQFGQFARTSASKILTQQLNDLTNGFIGGASIDFNVESYTDYTTGAAEGRTDLNVDFRKTFSDRLTIEVGTDFNIEGSDAAEDNTLSEFAGDVAIEYNITRDGNLRLRVFRQNEYEGILEGEVTETGAGLIYIRDFKNFKELIPFRKGSVPDRSVNDGETINREDEIIPESEETPDEEEKDAEDETEKEPGEEDEQQEKNENE